MVRGMTFFALSSALLLSSCAKKEAAEAPPPAAEAPAAAAPASTPPVGGPHAFVHLKNGTKVPGTIVASSRTDMVVAGDDGIEKKIPMAQIKSVEYGEAEAAKPASQRAQPARQAAREAAPAKTPPANEPLTPQPSEAASQPARPAQSPAPAVTTRTYELPAGSEVSLRTNETIDSATVAEGQTFDAQVTRDAKDVNGDVVIPRGSRARIVIKSASKGGRITGASDLVLGVQSVTLAGKQYTIDTSDVSQKGQSGVGANKRTATYTGGGAALGAIIGAIAGGGKGAAIGAGAGAGAGALAQVLTKGKAIKVPAESVLTFRLDKPLKVTRAE
jgi:hypothetical protein